MLASVFVWRCVGGLLDVVSNSATTSLGLSKGLDGLIFAQVVSIVILHELLRLATRGFPATMIRGGVARMEA